MHGGRPPMGAHFSVALAQEMCPKNWSSLPTSPELWAARRQQLSPDAIKMRQCNLGELCWLATVSRPDIRAPLARIASRVNSRQGRGVYRINDPVGTVQLWQQETVLKCASSTYAGTRVRGDVGGKMRATAGRIHCGAIPLSGWSDAAIGDQ